MKAKPYPDIELLRERLDYNPETGIITWKDNCRWVKGGKEAGCVEPGGYRVIRINNSNYYSHRIAWILYTETQPGPDEVIDHLNGNKQDNRIANLRCVSSGVNIHNQSVVRPSLSGRRGVYFKRDKNKFEVSITVNGVAYHLGSYDYIEEAIAVRERAEQDHGLKVR